MRMARLGRRCAGMAAMKDDAMPMKELPAGMLEAAIGPMGRRIRRAVIAADATDDDDADLCCKIAQSLRVDVHRVAVAERLRAFRAGAMEE